MISKFKMNMSLFKNKMKIKLSSLTTQILHKTLDIYPGKLVYLLYKFQTENLYLYCIGTGQEAKSHSARSCSGNSFSFSFRSC